MIQNFLYHLAQKYVADAIWAKLVSELLALALLIIMAMVTYYMAKFVMDYFVKPSLKRMQSTFLKGLASRIQSGLFGHLAAGLVFRFGGNLILKHHGTYTPTNFGSVIIFMVNVLSLLYFFITVTIIITSIIKAINPYYEHKFQQADRYPIKPYLNVAVFVVWIFSIVFMIAFFNDTSLTKVFTGLGAASAVFILIFRDTLLGIVSSIQAAAANIVRVGDRIAIDKYGLDGVVLNISINNVRIKNLDNVVTTIPTYMLTSEVVRNFRSLIEYGYRRIKQTIFIDVNSVKYFASDEVDKFDVAHLLNKYPSSNLDNKFITNLELFRLYVEDYLRNCPYISQKDDLVVYLLSPTAMGQPVEVYAFTSLINWAEYEHLQSQIIEYCLVKLRDFDLLAFQYKNG